MGKKPKARGPTRTAETPKVEAADKAQFERFVETARELGVDESGKQFERAFRKLVSQNAYSKRAKRKGEA